jgi:hypothetical protein
MRGTPVDVPLPSMTSFMPYPSLPGQNLDYS